MTKRPGRPRPGTRSPYRDIAKVHRCELLAAEVRAGRLKYRGIEDAAIRLRDMIDEMAHGLAYVLGGATRAGERGLGEDRVVPRAGNRELGRRMPVAAGPPVAPCPSSLRRI